jgi:hypothetical protein
MTVKYYYIIISQEDVHKNELLEEILRERVNFFMNKRKQVNFWIINSRYFINKNSLQEKLMNTRFFPDTFENSFNILIMSTDSNFIKYLHLKLGMFKKKTH